MHKQRSLFKAEWFINSFQRFLFLSALLLWISGCGRTNKEPDQRLILATTTSLQESGLLDELLPLFKKQTNIEVQIVAVGSGQALKIARQGDAEVVFAHSPRAEESFMADGFGEKRLPVMQDHFIIVGPPNDPAGIKQSKTASEALKKIAEAKHTFISRGDDSGTHVKEKEIWQQAGIRPGGNWYLEAGTGMASALRMAQEKDAYILCDRGTFLANRKSGRLVDLFEKDPVLINPYSMILVKQEKVRPERFAAARQFIEFMVSEPAQKIIGDFGKDQFGISIYTPNQKK